MGKGVLLELSGRQAVVLTPQGEFKRVPLPKGAHEIGDEIEYAETQPVAWTRWGMAAAAAALLLVAPLGYSSVLDARPVAVVTVDINPSLELTVNRKDQVLKVEALNPDGALVLDGVQWKRQPLADVLTGVTARAVAHQKLDPTSEAGAVVVAVAPAGTQELPKPQADRIRDQAYEAVSTVAPAANVTALQASREEKAEAAKVGLNVGKFVLYKELQEQNVPVTPEDLQRSGPGKVLKDLGINPGTIFKEAEKDHGGEPAGKAKGKSKSDQNDSLLPTLPVLTQPLVPDDKGGSRPNDKQSDDKKADDKGAQPKSDDKKVNPGKSDDKKTDDKKADDTKGNQGKSDDKKGPDAKSGSDKGTDSQKNEARENGKSGDAQDGARKPTWTVPFLGITIEKPAFLVPPAPAAPAAPRAAQPGAVAPVDTTDSTSGEKGKKLEESPRDRQSDKQEEKREERPNKQEDGGGKNQAPGQSGGDKGKR